MIKTEFDKGTMIVTTPQDGKAPLVECYVDRRIALSWPSPQEPGYYCVFGLLDEVSLTPGKPLVLLHEDTDRMHLKLIEKALTAAAKYRAHLIFADLSGGNEAHQWSFDRMAHKLKAPDVGLFDAHEFSRFEEGVLIALDKAKAKKLRFNTPTDKPEILKTELMRISPAEFHQQDHQTPEERFPAVAAMCHIVMSYEYFPWAKPAKPETSVKSGEGYR